MVLFHDQVISPVTADILPFMVSKLIPFLKRRLRILYSNCYMESDSLVYVLLLLTVQNGADDRRKLYQ